LRATPQADKTQCGAGEALIQLILDNTHTKVAINTFTTTNTTDTDDAAGACQVVCVWG